VKAFVEKPPRDAAPTDWINAGTYVLEPAVLDRVPTGLKVSIERDTFPRMLQDRRHLFAMRSADYWIDVGTPEQYLQVHADVLAGRLGLPPAPAARETAPGVWVQGATDATDQLRAPVLVGAGVEIGRDARVAGSVLGVGVELGEGATVSGSIVHDGARLGPHVRLTRSIVGPGAVIGANATIRDESIIGADTVVEPGSELVDTRIPDATAVRARS
jgi:NDP-sugar pyrophosphorylase family protein